eukprot:901722_1
MSLLRFAQHIVYQKAPLISTEVQLGFKIPSKSTVIGLVDISLMSMVIGSTVWVFFYSEQSINDRTGKGTIHTNHDESHQNIYEREFTVFSWSNMYHVSTNGYTQHEQYSG